MSLLAIFSIFGLAFFIKESDGPFDIMNKTRNYLMRNNFVGLFFYKLLSCYFCTGCHAGWVVYLLQMSRFKLSEMILWSFAGGVVCILLDSIISKLNR